MQPVPLGPDGEELPDGHRCPDCGGSIERLHRHALDRWASVFRSVHRYRCLDAACGWEGLVGRTVPIPPIEPARPAWRTRLLWLLAGITLAAAGMASVRLLQRANKPAPVISAAASAAVQARQAAPGVDIAGALLPPSDDRVAANTTPLTLKRHCAWGTPGGDRYRGTVAQALSAARLPPEVVRTVAAMAERRDLQDQVLISRDTVRTLDGQRNFSPRLRAMAFGQSLCFGTRVNFPAGHVEKAALYEVRDSLGRMHTIIVPYVCDNVAVLGEEEDDDEAPPPPDRKIPEPPSWTLGLAGLALLACLRHRKNSRVGPDDRRSSEATRCFLDHAHADPSDVRGRDPAGSCRDDPFRDRR